ncbi:MAG: phenylalanine--tRNA ligase subunit alpha [Solibacterales bacterium]|nr:phenylalanine--tRNA ligase subunit alpha [Bryobacterales bacterium]|tara:strand:- start:3263 stop:4339 length:1077 start_codon:yes stop_codon:yes gene_type:complete
MAIEDQVQQALSELLEAGATIEELYSSLGDTFERERAASGSYEDIKVLRDRWLGRKNGLLAATNQHWLKKAPRELKPKIGQLQNKIKQSFEVALAKALKELDERQLAHPPIDVTLPGPERRIGAKHPLQVTVEEICSIFSALGFSIAEGPEIETFYYNFEALNFPSDHPAVDEMDTLFIEDKVLLRTHTSPMQIRIMESQKPPLRYLVPGKVYRHDTADATHSPMFHQIEGFAVDKNITFGDLKGTLDHFAKRLFGSSIKTRFRASFFPFTEPSAEMDVTCQGCGGGGCRVCKQTGFIEMLGCGMIDPNVLKAVKYDPEQYQGFAFGLGIDRIAMRKYEINDIQLLYQGDIRFLRQFR